MALTIPSSSNIVVPNVAFVVPGFFNEPYESIVEELTPLLEPSRGFKCRINVGRFIARLGDPGVTYMYAGSKRRLHPFPAATTLLRDRVASTLGVAFNCAYVNVYANGDATLGRHSDIPHLPQLGQKPIIAAASFGAARPLQLWAAEAPCDRSKMVEVVLNSGDLFVMHGRSQLDWLHAIPKAKNVVEGRLSITFRHHNPA